MLITFSVKRQQLAGNCLGLDSMTGGEILWLSEKQGKEKEMRRDGGLSTARHVCVCVCEKYPSELFREMFREERAGVMSCWHVQSTLKLLGNIFENSKTYP